MVTLADVAREAGVSPMTVSNALRDKPNVSAPTRARVKEVARRLGYHVNVVAQGLRSGRTGAIGLAVPELDMPFPAHFAAEVTSAAARLGRRVIVQETHSDREVERAILEEGAGGLVDGMIITALGMDDAEIEAAVQDRAVVLMDERIGSSRLDVVCSPNHEGARDAGAHLVALGCRSLLVVGVGPEALEPPHGRTGAHLRLAGLLDGVHPAGVEVEAQRVLPAPWTPEGGRAAVTRCIDAGVDFDGVFCMTDSVALGVLRGLADRGVDCPSEVKVIGFDGVREGAFSVPSLSSIDVDKALMARSAVQMLLERIEHPHPNAPGRKVVAPFALVRRESTGGSAVRGSRGAADDEPVDGDLRRVPWPERTQ